MSMIKTNKSSILYVSLSVAVILLFLFSIGMYLWIKKNTTSEEQLPEHSFKLQEEDIKIVLYGDLTQVSQKFSQELGLEDQPSNSYIETVDLPKETEEKQGLVLPQSTNDFIQYRNRPTLKEIAIKRGDSLTKIATTEWGDVRLWPDLYSVNSDRLKGQNPDLIYVQQKLRLVEKIGVERQNTNTPYTEEEIAYLSSVYRDVYLIYREQAHPSLKSIDYLLLLVLGFNSDFFEQFYTDILPEDRERVLTLKRQANLIN